MSILSKIQALITAANATTGESDTTLTDAVQTLVGGYGQGGGGGNTLESDFLTVYKETVEVGENTVANSRQYADYLNSIKSIPGTLFAMSIHQKASYINNEWANGFAGTSPTGYRYRSTWQSSAWNSSSYDAVAPVGTLVDVYTVELKNPNNA